METYVVHLRYFVGDPLVEIREKDLDRIGNDPDIAISFRRIDNRTSRHGKLEEETLDRAIEDITQDIITVSSEKEENFRKAIIAIYDRYRSPRTPYGFWGGSHEGTRIARAVANEIDGGW